MIITATPPTTPPAMAPTGTLAARLVAAARVAEEEGAEDEEKGTVVTWVMVDRPGVVVLGAGVVEGVEDVAEGVVVCSERGKSTPSWNLEAARGLTVIAGWVVVVVALVVVVVEVVVVVVEAEVSVHDATTSETGVDVTMVDVSRLVTVKNTVLQAIIVASSQRTASRVLPATKRS